MAVAEVTGGSQTATIGTEHTLYTTVVGDKGKTLVLLVDCVNMAAGDILELRAYLTPRASGTERLLLLGPYSGPQDDSTNDLAKLKVSIPIPVVEAARFTLKQTSGTGRAFVYSVQSL